uniref:FAD-dependent oxidoreductase n=1 Tax=Cyanobium sp. TaxID=2164130 RepID=UPI00404A20DE
MKHRGRPGDVAVIGGGLAGGLVALALAERGLSVVLVSAASLGLPNTLGPATSWSYAGVLGPDLQAWGELHERHGDLGLRRRRLHRHGQVFGQVDLIRFCQALPLALDRLGVRQLQAQVAQPPRRLDGLWQLELQGQADGPPSLQVGQVVLAAGAGCRALWPGLSQSLRSSWAGILHLEAWPDPKRYPSRWLRRARGGGVVLPQAMARPSLEQRAGALVQEEWVVDPGLACLGEGLLVGQISLVRPGLELGDPPDQAVMESRLRQALGHFDPVLAELPARYRQVPVSFCLDGKALAGPVAGAPGLWALAGFRGAFGEVPRAVQALADQIESSLGSGWESAGASVG